MDYIDFIEQLKARINIVDVISRYIPVSQRGRQFLASCPFHSERTPSFSINQEGQFYHCFGCKASGDAIKFVSEIENITRKEAIEKLAASYGMAVPTFSKKSQFEKKDRDTLLAILKDTARFYHNNLTNPRSAAALEYLQSRGLNDSLVRKFGIGVSLDYTGLARHLLAKYNEADIIKAGVCDKYESKLGDSLGGRLIFPILNNLGEVVGFGGRILVEKKDVGKYKNTKQTPIFDKSKNLYAVNLLKNRKVKGGIEFVIVCEGYMDTISLHKYGYDTAVASMGTAFTVQQARLLARFSNNVYVCFDGDTAGKMATLRNMDILKNEGLNVKVIKLPDGYDPDDFLKKFGQAKFDKLIEQAKNLVDYKLEVLASQYDLKDKPQLTAYTKAALKTIRELKDVIEQNAYLETLRSTTNISIEVLRGQLMALPDETPSTFKATTHQTDDFPKNVYTLIYALISNFSFAQPSDEMLSFVNNAVYKDIINYIINCKKGGVRANKSTLYDIVDEQYHESIVANILSYKEFDNLAYAEQETKYNQCLESFKKSFGIGGVSLNNATLAELFEQYNTVQSEEERKEIEQQILKLTKNKQ